MSQAALDLNPQTLQELSVCLQATLSTEKQERKKGKDSQFRICLMARVCRTNEQQDIMKFSKTTVSFYDKTTGYYFKCLHF